MQGCIITQHTAEAKHTFRHQHVHHDSLNNKRNCIDELVKNAYLIRNSSTTSYIATMFHPTIGQRAHQSLSNNTTPELGMIPQGVRVKQAYA